MAVPPAGALPRRWVVMGVSGCGKSRLGAALAADQSLPFIEGDDFHPPANVAKMRAGTPLTDADRAGWLAALGQALAQVPGGAVLACSALKRSYRDTLRAAAPGLCFVYLALGREEARARVAARAAATGHFFSASLVDSQFDTLEDPVAEPGVLALPATEPVAALVARVRDWIPPPP